MTKDSMPMQNTYFSAIKWCEHEAERSVRDV